MMQASDHFICPVCGLKATTTGQSVKFDYGLPPAFFGYFINKYGKLTEPTRKGLCKQYDHKGDLAMVHFVVGYYGNPYTLFLSGKNLDDRGDKIFIHHIWRKGDPVVPLSKEDSDWYKERNGRRREVKQRDRKIKNFEEWLKEVDKESVK